MSTADGLDVAAYVSQTVHCYTSQASDEEWVTLIGMLNRSPYPGTTFLKRALEYALHDR
jgi:hypothetical protein